MLVPFARPGIPTPSALPDLGTLLFKWGHLRSCSVKSSTNLRIREPLVAPLLQGASCWRWTDNTGRTVLLRVMRIDASADALFVLIADISDKSVHAKAGTPVPEVILGREVLLAARVVRTRAADASESNVRLFLCRVRSVVVLMSNNPDRFPVFPDVRLSGALPSAPPDLSPEILPS